MLFPLGYQCFIFGSFIYLGFLSQNYNHAVHLVRLADSNSPPLLVFLSLCCPLSVYVPSHCGLSPISVIKYLNRPNMFYLSEIEHTLRLPPSLLDLPLHDAIKGELEGLFLDKVIANLGLCISVYDIRSIDGGFIFPGDGASTYTVRFRLVMFRPFVGEVIVAKLKESDANGLRLSLGFFDDILIPAHLMPNPSHIEPDPENQKQLKWVWEFEGANYPIDEIDEIRFRVQNVNYPKIPIEQEKLSTPIEEEKQSNPVKEKQSKPFAPMVITGSLDADGLGPVSWW